VTFLSSRCHPGRSAAARATADRGRSHSAGDPPDRSDGARQRSRGLLRR
jgi:hypothetical protein